MKLRNFLYLNTKVVEDYIAAIDGYTYDEETQAVATSNENAFTGKGALGVASGSGAHTGKQSEEIKRSVRISDAAKFEKVHKYLRSDEDDGLKYYEFLTDEDYAGLYRDDFLEVLVTARFSKMKELTNSVRKFAELATVLENITDQQFLDKKTAEAVNGLSMLGQMKSGKEIACVFEFDDRKHPLVAYLDESYFRCGQDSFVGQAYLLCKVIRKVPKGQSVKLDEIFEDIKKMPMNREQRRSMPKNLDNPAEVRDVIRGPALIVLPIAVYQ
ncbi:MAG: hypothetical protein IJO51_08325 [Clostridia bacterium]|nr:hypothetical protein [Clostridia bacterium]